MKIKLPELCISLLCLMTANAHAYTFNIDGDLSDWGVSRTGNASDWNPYSGIYHTIEDQNSNYLEPGWGGQNYDAEALYVYLSSTHLYIALATGHNPQSANESGSYGAGDFAIDFGKDGTYEAGINVKPNWDGFGAEGGFYAVTEWDYGLFEDGTVAGYVKSEHPTSIVQGNYIDSATLAILGPQTGYGEWNRSKHYFYEMSLERQLLVNAGWNGEAFNVHWTMNCANDSIITDPPGNAASVPEPSSLILATLGMIGFIRKQGKTAQ